MKTRLVLSVFMIAGFCLSSAPNQAGEISATNEVRQVQFAERVITIELVRAMSPSFREARGKCRKACPETGALELGIGLIGVSRSDFAAETLIKLLGLRLDGAGSEKLNCQILIHGDTISPRLDRLRPRDVVDNCQSIFSELRKRQLANVLDVKVEQVCRSESEIVSDRDDLFNAIKSKRKCDQ